MNFSIAAIGEAFGGIIKGLDGLFTSDEERLNAKNVIMGVQAQVINQFLQYEQKVLEAKASIINTEAQGESFLQRNWRPITMLAFVVSIMGFWFGLTPESLTQQSVDNMFLLVQIGLGGYVAGRSCEKIAQGVDFGKIIAKDKK